MIRDIFGDRDGIVLALDAVIQHFVVTQQLLQILVN